MAQVECGVVGIRILNGKAISHHSIVLQTGHEKFVVRGAIDFEDEAILFTFRNKPNVKNVKDYIKGSLGISVATVINPFALRGTLLKPERVYETEAVLLTLGSIVATGLTGGASLVGQGLWDVYKGRKVCDKAERAYDFLMQQEATAINDPFAGKAKSEQQVGARNER